MHPPELAELAEPFGDVTVLEAFDRGLIARVFLAADFLELGEFEAPVLLDIPEGITALDARMLTGVAL
jgi:hypothetical protein